jgi:hypothetical protein
MGTRGFSVVLHHEHRTRPVSPAPTYARPRRLAAPAAWLPLLALILAVAGCAALGAALRTSTALQAAGYQNANVNISTGSGQPAGDVVGVTYSRGPTGNDQRDAQGAEKIVWNNFTSSFGALAIVKVSGGCTGPVCVSHSTELASLTYAQLAAKFGPRPASLAKSGTTLPGWAVPVGLGVALGGIAVAAAITVLVLILRRKRRGPPGPPPWPPGQAWPPGQPWQQPWPPAPPSGSPPASP